MSLATRFAHLLGLASAETLPAAPAAAEPVVPAPLVAKPKGEGEEDEEEAKKAEQKEDESDEDYEKRTGKKGSKAKKKAEEEKEKEKADARIAGALAERERCAAILSHPGAAANMRFALEAAFGENPMSAVAATAALDAMPKRVSLSQRMAAEAPPVVQPEREAPAADTPEAFAAQCNAVVKKVRGEK